MPIIPLRKRYFTITPEKGDNSETFLMTVQDFDRQWGYKVNYLGQVTTEVIHLPTIGKPSIYFPQISCATISGQDLTNTAPYSPDLDIFHEGLTDWLEVVYTFTTANRYPDSPVANSASCWRMAMSYELDQLSPDYYLNRTDMAANPTDPTAYIHAVEDTYYLNIYDTAPEGYTTGDYTDLKDSLDRANAELKDEMLGAKLAWDIWAADETDEYWNNYIAWNDGMEAAQDKVAKAQNALQSFRDMHPVPPLEQTISKQYFNFTFFSDRQIDFAPYHNHINSDNFIHLLYVQRDLALLFQGKPPRYHYEYLGTPGENQTVYDTYKYKWKLVDSVTTEITTNLYQHDLIFERKANGTWQKWEVIKSIGAETGVPTYIDTDQYEVAAMYDMVDDKYDYTNMNPYYVQDE